jgi:hypothetical protein
MVYGTKSDGEINKKTPLFKCKEKSGFCSRLCLSGECRPFDMKV